MACQRIEMTVLAIYGIVTLCLYALICQRKEGYGQIIEWERTWCWYDAE